jgi:hypothetical protein
MSSIDTRLQAYWSHVKAFHLTGDDMWLIFVDNIRCQDTGKAQLAAERFLHRRQKVSNVADSS